jgi:Ca-activated chloride channel family protein
MTKSSPAARAVLWLTMLVSPCVPAAEQAVSQRPNSSDLILIIDASNSMWGQIDGENKIVMARRAVGELIDGLPGDTEVGLIAYGHRRKGDCDDIEVLSDVAPLDKSALKSTINAINPKGKTPITSSINAAIGLARERESAAIVLISDGLETCDLDPCAAVRTARQAGVPFVLHVIGFDVAGEDTSQLECAAQAGDGVFLNADSAPQLSEALRSAYEKGPLPDGRLAVGVTAEGELQDAVVTVRDAATGDEVAAARTYVAEATNPSAIPLDDGRYQATVAAVGIKGSPRYEFEFEIVEGNRVERDFDFSAGEVSISITRNGELSDATVNVLVTGERTQVAGGRTYRAATSNPLVLRIAAGTYDVVVKSVEMRNGPERRFSDVVINGGQRTDLEHEFISGVLEIGTTRSGKLVDAVVNAVDESGNSVRGGRTYMSESSNPLRLIVAPGKYRLRIDEIRGERRESEVVVGAGETTSVMIDLDIN